MADIKGQYRAIARDLCVTAFSSPLWNAKNGDWHRSMELGADRAPDQVNYYYSVCNFYAIARGLRIDPGLLDQPGFVEGAINWFADMLGRGRSIGYDSPGLTKGFQGHYAGALVPAALAELYRLSLDETLLSMTIETLRVHQELFPAHTARNVQASNHMVLALLSLYDVTGDPQWLDAARREGAFLRDECYLQLSEKQGCFVNEPEMTGFPRHCYGAWAMCELHRCDGDADWLRPALSSMNWWKEKQREDGGFYFFYNLENRRFCDSRIFSVHQKGMFLHSAWYLNRIAGGAYDEMIDRAVGHCDSSTWEYRSPEGWWCWRRSNAETEAVYSYELGWEILGHLLAPDGR